VQGAGRPGAIYRFDAADGRLDCESHRVSTHVFGTADVIELARALHRLPARLIVYGIGIGRAEPGRTVAPAVRDAIPLLVQRISKELLIPELPDRA
jgi:hydrogenase maturation protease